MNDNKRGLFEGWEIITNTSISLLWQFLQPELPSLGEYYILCEQNSRSSLPSFSAELERSLKNGLTVYSKIKNSCLISK
jgi:hypothetical protein